MINKWRFGCYFIIASPNTCIHSYYGYPYISYNTDNILIKEYNFDKFIIEEMYLSIINLILLKMNKYIMENPNLLIII